MSRRTSALTSPAITMARASWGPVSATQDTKARAVKKVLARRFQLAFCFDCRYIITWMEEIQNRTGT